MSHDEGRGVRSRQPTLPPISNRTLQHPSFMPLYMAAGFAHRRIDPSDQTVLPIIPTEFFYTDPTVSCERRTPNIVTELKLNTPPPVMSSCPAPPTRPDPFRSGPHPTRDLGSFTFKINTLHLLAQPNQVILQLTQEEDQAITNLLKLHHHEPLQSDETLAAPQMDLNPILSHPEPMDSARDVQHAGEASSRGQLQQGRCWSDTELEAAKTLLSRFSLMEKEKIWGLNHNKSAATLPDLLSPHQHQRSETLPASVTTDCTQNDGGYISFSCVRETGEPGWGGFGLVGGTNADDVHQRVCEEHLASCLPPRLSSLSSEPKAKSRSRVSGDLSKAKERMLSDSEGEAVHVLLSLRDMGALDTVQ